MTIESCNAGVQSQGTPEIWNVTGRKQFTEKSSCRSVSKPVSNTKNKKRIVFFQKQSGDIIEFKEKQPKNKPETKQKQSGEVIDSISGLKKQTGNEPENKAGHIVENKG